MSRKLSVQHTIIHEVTLEVTEEEYEAMKREAVAQYNEKTPVTDAFMEKVEAEYKRLKETGEMVDDWVSTSCVDEDGDEIWSVG